MKALNALLKVQAIKATQSVVAADHAGFHHSPYDWFIFDARMTSPKTCEVCKFLDMKDFRGDWIPIKFEYHTHSAVNKIRARVHRHCRCILWWTGRTKRVYRSPLGYLTPEEVHEVWRPTKKELENLTPSQFKQVFEFIKSPLRA